MTGLVDNLDDTLNDYTQDPLWPLVRAVIRTIKVENAASEAGLSARVIEKVRAGKPVKESTRTKLADYAVTHARSQLRTAGYRLPRDREALLATYLARQPAGGSDEQLGEDEKLCACGCGHVIPVEQRRGRPRRYIDDTHRKRAQRPTKAR